MRLTRLALPAITASLLFTVPASSQFVGTGTSGVTLTDGTNTATGSTINTNCTVSTSGGNPAFTCAGGSATPGGTTNSIQFRTGAGAFGGVTPANNSFLLTGATGVPGLSAMGTNVATALGVNVGSAGAFAKNNGDALSGTYTGAPTFSGNVVFSGIPVMSGVATGTIASGGNLGLDASGNVVKATVTSGGSATSITPGTTTVIGATAPCLIANSATTAMACDAITAGNITALSLATGNPGAPVLFNGAGGTPSSLTLTNATGLPLAGMPALPHSDFFVGDGTDRPVAASVTGDLGFGTASGGFVTGTVTGLQGRTIPSGVTTDGQLLIGNTATGNWNKATITAGSNVTVTNGNGTITIASSGGASGLTINSSTISGGAANKVLYDDGTKLQEGSLTSGSANLVVTAPLTISSTNAQNTPTDSGTHSYTVLSTDLSKELILASTFTGLAVPQATTTFGAGASFSGVTNSAVTATSTTSTINGIAGATGIKLGTNQMSQWDSDGTNWIVGLGLPQPATQTDTMWLSDDFVWRTKPLASSSVFGLAKVDGTTITASGGVISAVGGAATTITPGTTTVSGATAPCVIENSTSTTMACTALSTAGGFPIVVARGTFTMGTSAISSGTCATAVTVAATNVATTDVVNVSFNGDPTAVTGFVPAATGVLTEYAYPTSGNVNIKECNFTGSSITPAAHTFNWQVLR